MKEIDARGLSCSPPVLQTKAMIEAKAPSNVKVVVDNAAVQSKFTIKPFFSVKIWPSGL